MRRACRWRPLSSTTAPPPRRAVYAVPTTDALPAPHPTVHGPVADHGPVRAMHGATGRGCVQSIMRSSFRPRTLPILTGRAARATARASSSPLQRAPHRLAMPPSARQRACVRHARCQAVVSKPRGGLSGFKAGHGPSRAARLEREERQRSRRDRGGWRCVRLCP
jgi:hypothetical protein